jgi:hypothetical protein
VIEPIAGLLLAAQNRDGGWGPGASSPSSTEATAASVMAIGALGRPSLQGRVDDGLGWLTRTQNPDGGWSPTPAIRGSSWSTAPAVIAFANFSPASDAASRGWRWLVEHEGEGLGLIGRVLWKLFARFRVTELDPELKGWPWIPGAFSWVEPTALGLIALKKLRPSRVETKAAGRIQQGELMIYDRMCQGGGWNYGNSKTLGEALQPYPDTTALALLALADHRERPANQQSLDVLRRTAREVDSGLALALASLCLDVYGQDSSAFRTRLVAVFDETRFFGKTRSVALALLALSGGAEMLRVSHVDKA